MIAHRLSTVRDCDIIFYLENGEIKDRGTYKQLIDTSEGFKKIESK
jgi:ABC-type multidrug transport system fused ATPase/permease subunit